MKKYLSRIFKISLITGLALISGFPTIDSSVSANETEDAVQNNQNLQLPSHYEPIINEYEANAHTILSGKSDEIQNPSYLNKDILMQSGPGNQLLYALIDIDQNGVMELFIGKTNQTMRHGFEQTNQQILQIFSYDGEQVHDLGASLPEGNFSHADFLADGSLMINTPRDGVTGELTILSLNEESSAFVPTASFDYSLQDPQKPSYVDQQTDKTFTQEDFNENIGQTIDLFSLYTWSPMESNQAPVYADRLVPNDAVAGEQANVSLGEFMDVWGWQMGQNYQEYTLESPVDFYGAQLPQETFTILLNGEEQVVSYHGATEAPINCLAVYSDIEDTANPSNEKYLYLFVDHGGQPLVLVSMEGPDEQGRLQFRPTQNEALIQGFTNIYQP